MVNPESGYTNTEAAHTLQLLEQLLADGHEPLLGDEAVTEQAIGQRRVVTADSNSKLGIALYNPDMVAAQRAAVGETTGVNVDDILGHVEFSYAAGDSGVEGMVYIAPTRAIGYMRSRVTPADLRTEAAQACFSAAASVGLGSAWTNNLLAQLRGEDASAPTVVTLQPEQSGALNRQLEDSQEV
jgi:hypothetical protein